MNEKFTLPISIVIAGLLIGGGIYLNGKIANDSPSPVQKKQEVQKAKSEDLSGVIRPIDANDHVLGSAKARVLVVEYSDTECPYCKMFQPVMISIMQNYGKDAQVAWVYRHFPIAELHSKAPKEAEALECAAELGGNSKFWEYTNKIYEITPSDNGLDPSRLVSVAKDLGLSADKFKTCLDSGQYAARVNLDIQNAQELGAVGTPYSIVIDNKNNQYYPLEGASTYSELKNAIDMILSS